MFQLRLIARMSQGPSMLGIRRTRSVLDGFAKPCRRTYLRRRLVENVHTQRPPSRRSSTYCPGPVPFSLASTTLVRPAFRLRSSFTPRHPRTATRESRALCDHPRVCPQVPHTKSRGRRLAARRGGALHFRRSVLNAPLRVCARTPLAHR
ncbi:hypothetical protein OH76DRAFT_773831 [Lentinus brumalis]|uniref:Uncharacterized protein n=1 Tax=Lentinus brumalis TaxID=2498619 RepID=A0A371D478_9APHY|nr:hypothetical protein OH76DRAFT_773831 [Polyporus brumalis]